MIGETDAENKPEYEEIRLIKHSEKSTVHLVREKAGGEVFVRKILKGQHDIYLTLQSCRHPYLPRLYEVFLSEGSTTLIEEYVEGQPLGSVELSEKQLLNAVKELCSVLEYLHGKNIIHRDIKPSNIILAKDGHIRLIDFDAARMLRDALEQDTKLLGTRGYAPPEQYGFSQTDGRADIYALGVTLKQLLGEKAQKTRYRRIIQKCTNLNPDKRYQSVRQLKRALLRGNNSVLYGAAAFFALILLCLCGKLLSPPAESGVMPSESQSLPVLPPPGNPHWDGETGIAVWDNVPESGNGDGEISYHWRLYKRDAPDPPEPDEDMWILEGDIRGNGIIYRDTSTCRLNITYEVCENGFYYFAISADGDGIHYASSPYAISDAFEYTGESAPSLPAPEGLEWKMAETDKGRQYYASWANLDVYEDADTFNVWVYDKDGNYVMNNIWTKEHIIDIGYGGIRVRSEFLSDLDNAYRFTVEVYSSRPNEYSSYLMPDPVPEECYSPWLYRY